MKVEKIEIDKLVHDPSNARKHGEKNLEAIKGSLARFGQQKPIVVNMDNVVVAGNGTLDAAKSLGWTEINIVRTDLKGSDITAYALADNRTGELAEWDNDVLGSLLHSLREEDFDLASIGFDTSYLDSFNDDENLVEKDNEDIDEDEDEKTIVITKKLFSDDEILGDAFLYFREHGFPFPEMPVFEMKQEINKLANLDLEKCIRSNLCYEVADTYNKHRFEAAAIDMKSPVESFNDDKSLKKSLYMTFQAGSISYRRLGFFSIVSGTQACSNFRPGFARYIYEKFSNEGATVFDSSTGYGGRMTGFIASHCKKYIGTDPNTVTYNANLKLSKELCGDKTIELHNMPIEDLDVTKYIGQCDVAFTSPPYFRKEIYSKEATQSCNRYKEYQNWRDVFLKQMIEKNFLVLKNGAKFVLNIEDVKVKGKTYPLVSDSIALAKELGFTFIDTFRFTMSTRTYMSNNEKITEESDETVLVFQK
jgi:hypothetical protein